MLRTSGFTSLSTLAAVLLPTVLLVSTPSTQKQEPPKPKDTVKPIDKSVPPPKLPVAASMTAIGPLDTVRPIDGEVGISRMSNSITGVFLVPREQRLNGPVALGVAIGDFGTEAEVLEAITTGKNGSKSFKCVSSPERDTKVNLEHNWFGEGYLPKTNLATLVFAHTSPTTGRTQISRVKLYFGSSVRLPSSITAEPKLEILNNWSFSDMVTGKKH